MRNKNVLNSPRLTELKRKRRKGFLNKIYIFLFGLLVVLGFLIYIFHLHALNISNIQISGNSVIDTSAVKTEVQKEISGRYLWIFPKTNIFFYPQAHIKDDLSNTFKRFKTIDVSLKNRNTLMISVTERAPAYMWCGLTPPTQNTDQQQCYFMDDSGYIFDQAPYFSGDVYFKFYGTVPLSDGNPSGSIFSQDNFAKLISFKQALENLELKPAAVYVLDDGNVQMYLSNGAFLPADPEILFKVDANLENLAENVQAVLTTEPFQTEFNKKYSSLLYIDLRYGDKIYYKFK